MRAEVECGAHHVVCCRICCCVNVALCEHGAECDGGECESVRAIMYERAEGGAAADLRRLCATGMECSSSAAAVHVRGAGDARPGVLSRPCAGAGACAAAALVRLMPEGPAVRSGASRAQAPSFAAVVLVSSVASCVVSRGEYVSK